jgi:hypothetical protein
LLIKRHVFEAVDRFSTDYFMYSEDIDLCHKVRKIGWKIRYVPSAVVLHYGAGSSSRSRSDSTFSSVMEAESRWRFFRKTRSKSYADLYRIAMFFVSFLRAAMLLPLLLVLGRGGKAAPVHGSFRKWMSSLRWTLGLEKWVKGY